VAAWERVGVAPGVFATAVPAVDYRGDPQVSWIVDDGDRAVFHGGDTMWHGWWYRVRDSAPPVAAALLPVSGVMVRKPGFRPTGRPATLTPEEAVAATDLLEAECLVPIHFEAFHHPPAYAEQPDIRPRLERAARERGVRLRFRDPGTSLALPLGVAAG
jgi:L-ascorbate metabolism protein UlaG (beta-lactamase superfamily)